MSFSNSAYDQQFISERIHLLDALGWTTQGGVVENIQHIGATSVPGLLAQPEPLSQPVVDIGLAVWPFPLPPETQVLLERLGYLPLPGEAGASQPRFLHRSQPLQLFTFELGTSAWLDCLLLRDYLRQDAAACQSAAAERAIWPPNPQTETYRQVKTRWLEQLIPRAHAWWVVFHGFQPLESAVQELRELPCQWLISGGWALDLFLGQVTRVHGDVDVIVARSDQLTLQEYMLERGWQFLTPFQKKLEPWPAAMRLEPPRHQAHAHKGEALIDFLLTDIEHGVWKYRRQPDIVRLLERGRMQSERGLPFLAPELVLLFKSQNTSRKERGKDQADFEQALPHLEAERRAWLRWALTAVSPGHRWIEQLV